MTYRDLSFFVRAQTEVTVPSEHQASRLRTEANSQPTNGGVNNGATNPRQGNELLLQGGMGIRMCKSLVWRC